MARADQELWERYKADQDPQAREQLVLAYAPLVRYLAGRLAVGLPPQIELADLESYGMFGLMEAIERFDPRRGVKFETYAAQRVRGAILDGLRAETWAPALRQKARQLEEAYARLEGELGRSPTDAELARFLNLTPEELARREAEVGAAVLLSLEEGLTGPGGERMPAAERLADDQVADPAQAALALERRELLAEAIARLSEKEQLVVTLFYYEGLTAKEIAAVMGLSVARISQLHSKAILRLRGRLARQKQHLMP